MIMENLRSQLKFLQQIEVREIVEEAEGQFRKKIKEAEEKAEEIKKRKMKELEEKLRLIEDLEQVESNLEGKKKILGLKFEIFEDAFAKSVERLKEIVSNEEILYSESLKRLIVDAVIKLEGTEFEISTNSRDKQTVNQSLTELEKEILLLKGQAVKLHVSEETIDTLGGIIVRTKDKKRIFNNTLEARLDKIRNEMAGNILTTLFEGAED